jgi:hypothetical protein
MPDSKSSGTSTTATLSGASEARQETTRSPTRGHSSPSSQAVSSGLPKTRSAMAARSVVPNRSAIARWTSGVE